MGKTIEKKVKDLQIEFGEKLKRYRISRGIQSEYLFAQGLGFGRDTIYKIEKGDSMPSKRTLKQLKEHYELSDAQYKELLSYATNINALKKAIKNGNV